jgi:hypothetical protein
MISIILKIYMIMKKLIVLFVFSLFAVTYVNAQDVKDAIKEHKELMKLSKEELNAKSSKAARKDAKGFIKEGWKVVPGALPIEKQLDRAYQLKNMYDTDMITPLYITGQAMSTGENYDAAHMQVLELAKLNLASSIAEDMTALINNQLANKQLAANEAASLTKTVESGKSLISQKLGRVVPVVEMYRILPNGNTQVSVTVVYNAKMARNAGKETIREELEKEGNELSKELDKKLGLQ